tara:strand:+ start:1385 stop:1585 length:201 start_codon:yes stop_codon:yes gene_type:complete
MDIPKSYEKIYEQVANASGKLEYDTAPSDWDQHILFSDVNIISRRIVWVGIALAQRVQSGWQRHSN